MLEVKGRLRQVQLCQQHHLLYIVCRYVQQGFVDFCSENEIKMFRSCKDSTVVTIVTEAQDQSSKLCLRFANSFKIKT